MLTRACADQIQTTKPDGFGSWTLVVRMIGVRDYSERHN